MKRQLAIFLAAMAITSVCTAEEVKPVPVDDTKSIVTVEAVAPKHVPPAWLDSAMDKVSALPVVGPVVVDGVKWLGVVASLMTVLVTALLGALAALQKVLALAKLADLAAKVSAFSNGPIMYWLKWFSMYNAKREEKK